jgi:N-acetylmuramoyl-L-alanine amidase
MAMVLWVSRKRLFCVLVCAASAAAAALLLRAVPAAAEATAAVRALSPPAVVIDAGHGGEDGGAVAADGTTESGINLELALRIDALMRFCGRQTVLTRSSDVSIYSPGAKSLRQKKVSDLKNRVALVNGCPGAFLLSIHQNCMPSAPSVHGAQVFYNGADGAQACAQAVQASLNRTVNSDGAKTPKRISDSIYLMKNVSAPAVLVECGFLSNREETARLQQPAYQKKLAAAIAAGYLQSAKEGESHETKDTFLLHGVRK